MSYEHVEAEAARLCILKELVRQTDGRANDAVLSRVLDIFGIRRSREWVRTQLRKLEELDAIRIVRVGENALVAELTRLGRDHVERRQIIEGVARPSEDD